METFFKKVLRIFTVYMFYNRLCIHELHDIYKSSKLHSSLYQTCNSTRWEAGLSCTKGNDAAGVQQKRPQKTPSLK